MAFPLDMPAGLLDAAIAQNTWDTKGCVEVVHDDITYVVAMNNESTLAEQSVIDAGVHQSNLDETQGYKVHWGQKL